ncbi:MAG: hypothetical protein WCW66_01135 [Patescibacteria group bacterium]
MSIEGEQNVDRDRKPQAFIRFGLPGHETEYVFKTQANKYSEAETMSDEWEYAITQQLGAEWAVMNRGERIEIIPPRSQRTPETDQKVNQVIMSVIGDGYEFPEEE